MNIKNPSIQVIIVSIIAAVAILLASAAFEGAAETLTYIIIAIWWIPYSILTMRSGKQSEEAGQK